MNERENALRVITRSGEPEWVPNGLDCYDLCIPTDVVRERPTFAEGSGYDWFGCYWDFDPKTLGYAPVPGKHPVKDITKWRDYVHFPDIESIDWENAVKPTISNWNRDEKLSNIFWESGPWERVHALIGFQEALEGLYEEPEAMHELLGAITDYKVALVDRIAEYYKPDIISIFDDFAHQKSLLMSPQLFRQFILPCEKRIGDAIKKHNIIYSTTHAGKSTRCWVICLMPEWT